MLSASTRALYSWEKTIAQERKPRDHCSPSYSAEQWHLSRTGWGGAGTRRDETRWDRGERHWYRCWYWAGRKRVALTCRGRCGSRARAAASRRTRTSSPCPSCRPRGSPTVTRPLRPARASRWHCKRFIARLSRSRISLSLFDRSVRWQLQSEAKQLYCTLRTDCDARRARYERISCIRGGGPVTRCSRFDSSIVAAFDCSEFRRSTAFWIEESNDETKNKC